MKKLRLMAILVLLAVASTTLIACPIVPHAFDWEIYSIHRDVTFINGNTLRTQILQGVGYYRTNGIHARSTYIEFCEDGSLIFKPMDEDELCGTYRCKNNGLADTTVYIELENGESIEALGVGGYYEDSLYIDYHGTAYKFSSKRGPYGACKDEEEYNAQLRDLAESLRYFEENPNRSQIHKANVVFDEKGGATLVADDTEIDLYAENLGIYATRITDNNEVVFLERIEEGECYYYGTYTKEHSCFISLFYLDPLPNYDEENPKPLSIFDLVPELEAFYSEDARQNITIKMGKELVNADPGFYHTYSIITEQDDIDNILSILSNMVLWEDAAPSDSDLDSSYYINSVTLTDNTGALSRIKISSCFSRIKIGDKYYFHNSADFPEFIYDGAYHKFICQNYAAKLYNGEVFVDYTNILADLEYVVDPNQDYSYSTLHDTRTLVCEFGEITIYDDTHFWYKGQFYLSVGERDFSEFFDTNE